MITAKDVVEYALASAEETLADYERGVPEPALDSAGDTLDLVIAALRVIQQHPELAPEFEVALGKGPLKSLREGIERSRR
jgi:hypothetical protein